MIRFLKARAENVAVGMLAAMFLTFIVQIAARYVFRTPLGWSVELCLMLWLWLVFWTCAFCLRDRDHVKFDILYLAVSPGLRRMFALTSALAIVVGIAAALPASVDYITFYKIKKSATLRIRLDYVFSIYGVFALAVIGHYAVRFVNILRGATPVGYEVHSDEGEGGR